MLLAAIASAAAAGPGAIGSAATICAAAVLVAAGTGGIFCFHVFFVFWFNNIEPYKGTGRTARNQYTLGGMRYTIFGSDLVDGFAPGRPHFFKVGRRKPGNFFELCRQVMHAAKAKIVGDLA
jgi:hypothetical protein